MSPPLEVDLRRRFVWGSAIEEATASLNAHIRRLEAPDVYVVDTLKAFAASGSGWQKRVRKDPLHLPEAYAILPYGRARPGRGALVLFQTPTFVVFFAIFLVFYLLTQGRLRLQNALILVGSYVFYAAWDERFLVLIIASTATDFLAGSGASGRRLTNGEIGRSAAYVVVGSLLPLLPTLPQSGSYLAAVVVFAAFLSGLAHLGRRIHDDERRQYFYITLSVCVNLGVLGVFKYFNFFADSLVTTLAQLGVENVSWTTLEIVLPVGISFYTFQTISYSIDVHRGDVEPSDRLLEFAAFVAFFPQLVAGPVERAKHLLPQFFEERRIERKAVETGLTLFVWGLFKKTVVADNLAGIVVIFADPGAMTTGDLAAGLLAFAFQIYGDFGL